MVKLIAIIADWEKGSEYLIAASKEVSEKLGVKLEVRKEDWDFLTQYGEKDEFGGVDIPQLFIQTESGKILHVMTRTPLTSDGKPDIGAAKKKIIEMLEGAKS